MQVTFVCQLNHVLDHDDDGGDVWWMPVKGHEDTMMEFECGKDDLQLKPEPPRGNVLNIIVRATFWVLCVVRLVIW